MNNKHITLIFLMIGIVLLLSGLILAFVSTIDKNIVGGADIHTFLFIFFNENGGVYFYLTLLGVTELIVLSILRRISK